MDTFYNLSKSFPKNVRIVAVSKTHTVETILQAYNKNYRIFGENKSQEIVQKYNKLPKDIEWHFIGHLQTNKVKYIAPFVSFIHAVDSQKLLEEINKQAKKYNRTINCLMQVHIAQEQTKFGYAPEKLAEYLKGGNFKKYNNAKIVGLMGMATYTQDTEQIRNEFKTLKALFDNFKNTIFENSTDFCEISMGMSNDYKIAIEEGSTMLRLGTLIFGERKI